MRLRLFDNLFAHGLLQAEASFLTQWSRRRGCTALGVVVPNLPAFTPRTVAEERTQLVEHGEVVAFV